MKCKHCETIMDIDPFYNVHYCPKDCADKIFDEKYKQEEAQKSPEQKAVEGDESGLFPPPNAIYKQTYCWVSGCPRSWYSCRSSGKMPSKFSRTPEISDEPYGHFCPDCGHSLRNNPTFGEGGSKDKGKK